MLSHQVAEVDDKLARRDFDTSPVTRPAIFRHHLPTRSLVAHHRDNHHTNSITNPAMGGRGGNL